MLQQVVGRCQGLEAEARVASLQRQDPAEPRRSGGGVEEQRQAVRSDSVVVGARSHPAGYFNA